MEKTIYRAGTGSGLSASGVSDGMVPASGSGYPVRGTLPGKGGFSDRRDGERGESQPAIRFAGRWSGLFRRRSAGEPDRGHPASEPVRQPESGGPERPAAPRYGFPTWFDFLALVGLFAVVQLAAFFILWIAGVPFPDAAALQSGVESVREAARAEWSHYNALNYPLSMGLMIALTLLYRRLRGGNHRLGRYASRGLDPVLILWGIVLMLAVGVVLEPLLRLLPPTPDFYGRGGGTVLMAVVLAPVLEEFLCRGILLDAARARRGAAYGLIFSSCFFAVMHLYPAAVFNAFVLGLLFGVIYIRSNSLYIVVILHAFNNALALLLLTLGYGDRSLREWLGNDAAYTVVYAVSVLLFVFAVRMVWKTLARLRSGEPGAEGERSGQ